MIYIPTISERFIRPKFKFQLISTRSLFLIGYYNLVAITTLLLWDILITISREKVYIWSYHSKANWTTLFYIINRYLPFIVNIICLLLPQFWISTVGIFCSVTGADLGLEEECLIFYDADTTWLVASLQLFAKAFSILYTIPWFITLACMEILFVRRVIALHEGSKLISRILTGLLLCELASALFLLFHFTFLSELSKVIITSIDSPIGLSPLGIPNVFPPTYFALPEFVFQAVLLVLIMTKVIWDWKTGTARSNLGSILIRDGLWSYFCNLCGLVVIIIHPAGLSGPFDLPNVLWSYASFSVTSSRLVLNIRAAANRQGSTSDEASPNTSARLAFFQSIRSFFGSTNDEISVPHHYHDLGDDSGSEDNEL